MKIIAERIRAKIVMSVAFILQNSGICISDITIEFPSLFQDSYA